MLLFLSGGASSYRAQDKRNSSSWFCFASSSLMLPAREPGTTVSTPCASMHASKEGAWTVAF